MADNDRRSARDMALNAPGQGLGRVAENLSYAADSRRAYGIDPHPDHKEMARGQIAQAREARTTTQDDRNQALQRLQQGRTQSPQDQQRLRQAQSATAQQQFTQKLGG